MSNNPETQPLTIGVANPSTDPPSHPDSHRGVRALFILGAILSGCVMLLGAVMWIFESVNDEGGYNSKSSAMIACIHFVLSLLGLAATSLTAQRVRVKSITGLMASGYVFVTGVIYLELLAGFFYPREPAKITPYESAPIVSWRLQSNFSGEYAGFPLETNALGFRSPPLSEEVNDRTVRIVCLGDSITFGHAVEAKYAYPQQLARILRKRYPQKDWQVINTGVPGYCTFQETEQLKRCLDSGIRPDLVVLLFCLNDVTEKYTALKQFGGTGLGYQKVADGTGKDLFRAMVWLRQYSSLITAITPTQAAAQRMQAYKVNMLWRQPDAPHIQNAWTQAENELDELVQLCKKEDIGLLIAVPPFRQQFSSEEQIALPQRRLANFAQSRHVEFVDLLPSLKEQAAKAHRTPESYYVDRPHMNAEGNHALARIIADHFQLPTSPQSLRNPMSTEDKLTAGEHPGTPWQRIVKRKLSK